MLESTHISGIRRMLSFESALSTLRKHRITDPTLGNDNTRNQDEHAVDPSRRSKRQRHGLYITGDASANFREEKNMTAVRKNVMDAFQNLEASIACRVCGQATGHMPRDCPDREIGQPWHHDNRAGGDRSQGHISGAPAILLDDYMIEYDYAGGADNAAGGERTLKPWERGFIGGPGLNLEKEILLLKAVQQRALKDRRASTQAHPNNPGFGGDTALGKSVFEPFEHSTDDNAVTGADFSFFDGPGNPSWSRARTPTMETSRPQRATQDELNPSSYARNGNHITPLPPPSSGLPTSPLHGIAVPRRQVVQDDKLFNESPFMRQIKYTISSDHSIDDASRRRARFIALG
jgi:hypothetical protein